MAITDETLDSVIPTLVVFGIISIVLYLFILRPLALARPSQGNASSSDNPELSTNFTEDSTASTLQKTTSWPVVTRKPPHATKCSESILVQGMVSFRNSTAATYESTMDPATIDVNRKERARILARILSLDSSGPNESDSNIKLPQRGGWIVVSVPEEDVMCPRLRRILFLLATYLSVIVIISVKDSSTDEYIQQLIDKIRGSDVSSSVQLPEAVLPSHRIVAAQSLIGRIAIARQLGTVEFVLDFDTEMKSQLVRFGYKVIVYGNQENISMGSSRLAQQLDN
jgi:hypothetical protein